MNLRSHWSTSSRFGHTEGGTFSRERRVNKVLSGRTSDAPGPASYDLQNHLKEKGPSYSMKVVDRQFGSSSGSSRYETPGPGSYNAKVDLIKQNLGRVSIGRERRRD